MTTNPRENAVTTGEKEIQKHVHKERESCYVSRGAGKIVKTIDFLQYSTIHECPCVSCLWPKCQKMGALIKQVSQCFPVLCISDPPSKKFRLYFVYYIILRQVRIQNRNSYSNFFKTFHLLVFETFNFHNLRADCLKWPSVVGGNISLEIKNS